MVTDKEFKDSKLKEYFNKDGAPILKKTVCAFIDILGFQNLIKQNSQEALNTIYNAVQQAINAFDTELMQIKIFSDNIFISEPETDPHIEEAFISAVISAASSIQSELLKSGIFVRGAISYGYLFYSDTMIYGDPIISAYSLEKDKAVYPRIIIDPLLEDLIKEIQTHQYDPLFFPELIRDQDGYLFLNYPEVLRDEDGECEESQHKPIVEYLTIHKDRIEAAINEQKSNLHVMDKYLWVARYHNYICIQYGAKDKQIDLRKIDPSFKDFKNNAWGQGC